MMEMMKRSILLAVLAAVPLAGCQDLDVANLDDPDRERALTEPANTETLVAASWRTLWTRWHNGSAAYNPVPLIADEMSGTYANDAALELSSEPRVPFNNTSTADAHAVSRFPWESFYQALSNVNDGMFAINNGLEIVVDGVDNTDRLYAYAKWIQAQAHGWLSLLFDQAFIAHEDSELPENIRDLPSALPLLPYTQVRDTAVKYMEEAIELLEAANYTIPASWIPDRERTSAELARAGHSYIAQYYVYGARTPAERAALPWQSILDHIDQGITQDFVVDLNSQNSMFSNLMTRMQTTGTFSAWGDYKLIGPADTSGNFAAWLARPLAERERFLIHTPDKRITGATPTSNGEFFRYRADNIFRPERGLYHHSHYQWRRNQGRTNTGTYPLIRVDEMNLIRAEALYYLGRLDEAAEMVNITRTRPRTTQRIVTADPPATTFPGLPPVTAAGVPQSSGCVPRLDGVNCADLLGAIMYERMVEGALINAFRGYVDSRGWGRLPDGTLLHFPIPARELAALNMPVYSFGGVGGPAAAECTQPFCD